jgi:hypothetical protein
MTAGQPERFNGFPRAAGIDNFSQISVKNLQQLQKPVNKGTSVFGKLFMISLAAFGKIDRN